MNSPDLQAKIDALNQPKMGFREIWMSGVFEKATGSLVSAFAEDFGKPIYPSKHYKIRKIRIVILPPN